MAENKIRKVRLDLLLLERYLVSSREEAKIFIIEGKVFVNNQREDKLTYNEILDIKSKAIFESGII